MSTYEETENLKIWKSGMLRLYNWLMHVGQTKTHLNDTPTPTKSPNI